MNVYTFYDRLVSVGQPVGAFKGKDNNTQRTTHFAEDASSIHDRDDPCLRLSKRRGEGGLLLFVGFGGSGRWDGRPRFHRFCSVEQQSADTLSLKNIEFAACARRATTVEASGIVMSGSDDAAEDVMAFKNLLDFAESFLTKVRLEGYLRSPPCFDRSKYFFSHVVGRLKNSRQELGANKKIAPRPSQRPQTLQQGSAATLNICSSAMQNAVCLISRLLHCFSQSRAIYVETTHVAYVRQ